MCMTRLEKFLELSYLARIGTLTHHGHIELRERKMCLKICKACLFMNVAQLEVKKT